MIEFNSGWVYFRLRESACVSESDIKRRWQFCAYVIIWFGVNEEFLDRQMSVVGKIDNDWESNRLSLRIFVRIDNSKRQIRWTKDTRHDPLTKVIIYIRKAAILLIDRLNTPIRWPHIIDNVIHLNHQPIFTFTIDKRQEDRVIIFFNALHL